MVAVGYSYCSWSGSEVDPALWADCCVRTGLCIPPCSSAQGRGLLKMQPLGELDFVQLRLVTEERLVQSV